MRERLIQHQSGWLSSNIVQTLRGALTLAKAAARPSNRPMLGASVRTARHAVSRRVPPLRIAQGAAPPRDAECSNATAEVERASSILRASITMGDNQRVTQGDQHDQGKTRSAPEHCRGNTAKKEIINVCILQSLHLSIPLVIYCGHRPARAAWGG